MGYIDDQEQKRILSQNLTYYIELSGREQKEIAIALDINPPTLNQWVNGKAIPSVSMLKKLARFFDVSLGDLVNSRQENYYLKEISPHERKLIEAYRKALPYVRFTVEKLLNVDDSLLPFGGPT